MLIFCYLPWIPILQTPTTSLGTVEWPTPCGMPKALTGGSNRLEFPKPLYFTISHFSFQMHPSIFGVKPNKSNRYIGFLSGFCGGYYLDLHSWKSQRNAVKRRILEVASVRLFSHTNELVPENIRDIRREKDQGWRLAVCWFKGSCFFFFIILGMFFFAILLMEEILHQLISIIYHYIFTNFYTSQVVQDFFHQQ